MRRTTRFRQLVEAPEILVMPGVHDALPTFERVLGSRLRTPDEGADTIVWLCLADEPLRSPGRFWLDRRPRATHRLPSTRESAADRQRLWDTLVGLAATAP